MYVKAGRALHVPVALEVSRVIHWEQWPGNAVDAAVHYLGPASFALKRSVDE